MAVSGRLGGSRCENRAEAVEEVAVKENDALLGCRARTSEFQGLSRV